uniref:AlNc14C177G8149 protein n=1 Tax=Albugo laibachii Nc14 TaxID=890382 RepID=F0WNZ6_9STRA|nr:AlNc14C177G8149 [Albugo laibachii Nc14]|eukprot:CCA23039.1 AlNc14C177G8149 [Albugo laibachii Nc14]
MMLTILGVFYSRHSHGKKLGLMMLTILAARLFTTNSAPGSSSLSKTRSQNKQVDQDGESVHDRRKNAEEKLEDSAVISEDEIFHDARIDAFVVNDFLGKGKYIQKPTGEGGDDHYQTKTLSHNVLDSDSKDDNLEVPYEDRDRINHAGGFMHNPLPKNIDTDPDADIRNDGHGQPNAGRSDANGGRNIIGESSSQPGALVPNSGNRQPNGGSNDGNGGENPHRENPSQPGAQVPNSGNRQPNGGSNDGNGGENPHRENPSQPGAQVPNSGNRQPNGGSNHGNGGENTHGETDAVTTETRGVSAANEKATKIQMTTLGVVSVGALGAGTASVLGGIALANQQAANTTAPSSSAEKPPSKPFFIRFLLGGTH